jgi:hypothetical protein
MKERGKNHEGGQIDGEQTRSLYYLVLFRFQIHLFFPNLENSQQIIRTQLIFNSLFQKPTGICGT